MLRLGPPPSETREMDLDDIFFSRLKLMVIMAKAFLEGYPLGEHRCRAMLKNAEHIETDVAQMEPQGIPAVAAKSAAEASPYDHIFFQRVKLLTVMIKAVAKGFPMGEDRRQAMQENLDIICRIMMFNSKAENMTFLKVA